MDIKYYIVEGSALPDVYKRVVKVRRLLEADLNISVNAACRSMNIGRSTYYKYKDRVFEFYEDRRIKIVTFSLNFSDKQGLLSSILEMIAESKANILTINQNIPVNGMAVVVISVETVKMEGGIEVLLDRLRNVSGVAEVRILSRS